MTTKKTVIVSACLLGKKCRYDGGDAKRNEIIEKYGDDTLPLCPEELGGLPTPRPRAEIKGGTGEEVLDGKATVVDETGTDVTPAFIQGARDTILKAIKAGATKAVLKENSPSCGVNTVYSDGKLTEGMGVAAAALKRAGIEVEGVE